MSSLDDDSVDEGVLVRLGVDDCAGLEALVDSFDGGFGLDVAAEDDELGIGRLWLVGVVEDEGAEIGDFDGGGLAELPEG